LHPPLGDESSADDRGKTGHGFALNRRRGSVSITFFNAAAPGLRNQRARRADARKRGGFRPMSMDQSLKKGGGLTRARNVLTRAERLALLQEDEKWKPTQGVYNLPKTKYRRLAPGQSGPIRPGAEG